MKRDALTHPKMLDIASKLGISRAHAVGILNLLFDFTATHAPQGNIGKHRNGSIAMACDWTGDADAFVDALIETGWVDMDSNHRLLVHDWHVHCEQWVKQKLTKLKLDFATPSTEVDSKAVATAVATAVTTAERTDPGVSGAAVAPTVVVPSRDLPYPTLPYPSLPKSEGALTAAWTRWKSHLLQKFNYELGEIEAEQIGYELARWYEDEQVAIIAFSIARGAKNLIMNGDHKKPERQTTGGSRSGKPSMEELGI